jgi:hypothetical protein
VIAGLRAEFPGFFHALASIPGPRISRASLVWAVLAAVGAQLIVSAIVQLAVAAIYPVLFPPTSPPPFRFSIRLLWECAGAIAAGVVVLRAGGLSATLGYLVLQLLLLAAYLPVRLFNCSRTVPSLGPDPESCDYVAATLVTDRWPFWLAFALGIVFARFLPVRSGGTNELMRAAGVLSVCTAIGGALNALWIVYRPTSSMPTDLFMYLSVGAPYWIGLLAGGGASSQDCSCAAHASPHWCCSRSPSSDRPSRWACRSGEGRPACLLSRQRRRSSCPCGSGYGCRLLPWRRWSSRGR